MARVVLGVGTLFCLGRCPQFRAVLVEGFHSIRVQATPVWKAGFLC